MATEVWVNMLTAPREAVADALTFERENILRQICQLKTSLQSANDNRFADNPIHLSLDFEQGIAAFEGLSLEEQNKFMFPDDQDDEPA